MRSSSRQTQMSGGFLGIGYDSTTCEHLPEGPQDLHQTPQWLLSRASLKMSINEVRVILLPASAPDGKYTHELGVQFSSALAKESECCSPPEPSSSQQDKLHRIGTIHQGFLRAGLMGHTFDQEP